LATATISKAKKNDHVFHNPCLDKIVSYYKRQQLISQAIVWTDNCAGQYKCSANFLKIATFSKRITHRFAQKYHFKGVWDASGKVVKDYMRDQELSKNRFPNAWVCFVRTREKLKLPKKQADIFKRNTYTVSRRFFGYGTENKAEYDEKSNTHHHVIYTNREHVPRMNRVEGTLKLHYCILLSAPMTIEPTNRVRPSGSFSLLKTHVHVWCVKERRW
jgi:hypothetical protein